MIKYTHVNKVSATTAATLKREWRALDQTDCNFTDSAIPTRTD
jgi:hypothetical protein